MSCVYHSNILELALDVVQLVGVHVYIVFFEVVHVVLASLSVLINLEILIRYLVEWQLLFIIQINEWLLRRLEHITYPSIVTVLGTLMPWLEILSISCVKVQAKLKLVRKPFTFIHILENI